MELEFDYCDFSNPAHLTALADMINHYMADSMGGVSPHSKIRQLRLIDGLANHPTAEVLFAILGNRVVGLATCFVNYSTFNVAPYLYVHDFVVHADSRGKGIGRAMMNRLIDSAKERDFCKVTLEVRTDNVVAQNLYRELGFSDTEPPMHFWTLKVG